MSSPIASRMSECFCQAFFTVAAMALSANNTSSSSSSIGGGIFVPPPLAVAEPTTTADEAAGVLTAALEPAADCVGSCLATRGGLTKGVVAMEEEAKVVLLEV